MELLGYFFVLCLFTSISHVQTLVLTDLVIIIISQKEGYHAAHAEILRNSIFDNAHLMDKKPPIVVTTHELNINGSWTIVPMVAHLSKTYPTAGWFFFCLENTVIRLDKLLDLLSQFDADKDLWLGHALYDHEPTIIHHFANHKKKFKYPHFASGFAMTAHLLHGLAKDLHEYGIPDHDISIDASYEFAMLLKDRKGVRLKHVSSICVVSGASCVTYPRFFHPCDSVLSSERVYFAVKTCAKHHEDRVKVLKNLWAKHPKHIGYFSDAADKNLPDAYIVPNTTEGHCAKTFAILKETSIILRSKDLDWLIISDDDTILSVTRLLRLLTCYNPKHSVAIGERYGFRLWAEWPGYEYLTGGAGVVLSAPLVHELVKPGACKCPSATTPDDMYLFGSCLSRAGVQPTHCPMFHQARPSDYATPYLASQDPISFHKFWMIDPKMVYDEWFAEADSVFATAARHTEL